MIASSAAHNEQKQTAPKQQPAGLTQVSQPARTEAPRLRPVADAFESDGAFLVVMDVPGVTQDHVSVTLEGERLSVRAERHERGQLGAVYEQQYVVPQSIERDNVQAKLDAGVLSIVLPKAPAVRPKQIAVSST